jgi:chromosome segregation ATPase
MMPRVPDELLPILTRFHQDILMPDVRRVVREEISAEIGVLRDEMHTAFDGLAQRLDRLEIEYQMLVAGMRRLEERMGRVEQRLGGVEQRLESVEQKLDRVALKSDLLELKARVEDLERRLNELDAS